MQEKIPETENQKIIQEKGTKKERIKEQRDNTKKLDIKTEEQHRKQTCKKRRNEQRQLQRDEEKIINKEEERMILRESLFYRYQ